MELKTIGELYRPAMEITDQQEANKYLEYLVDYYMQFDNNTHEKATQIARHNLGYYAGYCSSETQSRVYKLFSTTHPIFGNTFAQGE